MTKLKLDKLFQPYKAIREENKNLFVGRESFFKEALFTLSNPGGSLAIIGERGIGKTSFAWQLKDILSGDEKFLKENNIFIPFEIKNYKCAWIECSSFLRNIEGVLIRLLTKKSDKTDENSLYSLFQDIIQEKKISEKLNKIIGSKALRSISNSYPAEYGTNNFDEQYLLEILSKNREAIRLLCTDILETLNSKYDNILIFIDELDRLPDKSGIAEIIKQGSGIQFVLVGIADDINEIISHYESSERKFIGSTLIINRFDEENIKEFYVKAQTSIDNLKLNFNEDFVESAIEYSDGFPYMVQSLGTLSIRDKIRYLNKEITPDTVFDITNKEFSTALNEITDPVLDNQNRHARIAAVDNSGKESILFYLCESKKGWINSDEMKESIDSNYRFYSNLNELEAAQIIKVHNDRIRYIDPIMKAIIKKVKNQGKKLYKKAK